MHRIAISILLLAAAAAVVARAQVPAGTIDSYGRLLSTYVTPEGVRYDAWRAAKSDVEALSTVVAALSRLDVGALPARERHAALINLYNATVLLAVLEGKPGSSIKDLSKGLLPFEIFDRPMVTLGGEKVSLNQLEERVRMESKDPRVHFAVNCASISCPPVAAEPFVGAELDAQLDAATKAFLARPGSLRLSGEGREVTLSLSKIFDWYAKDFEWKGGAVAFVAAHGPAPIAARLKEAGASVKLEYQDYDWSLNRAP